MIVLPRHNSVLRTGSRPVKALRHHSVHNLHEDRGRALHAQEHHLPLEDLNWSSLERKMVFHIGIGSPRLDQSLWNSRHHASCLGGHQ